MQEAVNMKPWQHGYEIDYLNSIVDFYSHYNSYSLSPFSKMKKNTVAELLHKKTLNLVKNEHGEMIASFTINQCKVSSDITLHGKVKIGIKLKGDLVVSNLAGEANAIKNILDEIKSDCWVYVWAEDREQNQILNEIGYQKINPKITTFGEIYNVFYRGSERIHPQPKKADLLSITKVCDVNAHLIEQIANKLAFLPEFTNHYSNYNKGKSWSALSLRGYSSDPSFITKPSEMSDKWNEENSNQVFEMQDTPLYETFPEVRELLKEFDSEIHRIRFMKLNAGGGELERHTDQVDSDSGGSIGKLARLHFPIKTNPDVKFTVWNLNAEPETVNMNVGECWFLDTRKPHKAINGGSDERIHLVVDVLVNEQIEGMLCK
jgi:hypothetical protein